MTEIINLYIVEEEETPPNYGVDGMLTCVRRSGNLHMECPDYLASVGGTEPRTLDITRLRGITPGGTRSVPKTNVQVMRTGKTF